MDLMEKFDDTGSHALKAGVCLLAVVVCYQIYERNRDYWARFGVKGTSQVSFLTEIFNVLFKNRAKMALERTLKYGKVHGLFLMGKPRLVIADAEVMRQICIKDFQNFPNHNVNEWANKYQRNFLVFLQGDHWKRQRTMMSPQFTSGKMKRMYKLLDGCSDDLIENFREQMIAARRDGRHSAEVDLFGAYSLYTMDGITTCCYGLKLERERGVADIKRASTRNALVRDCAKVFGFNPLRFGLLVLVPKFILRAMNFHMVAESDMLGLVKRVEHLVEQRRSGKGHKYDDLLQMLVDARSDDEMELGETDKLENHHAGLTHESLISDQNRLKTTAAAAVRLSTLEIVSESLLLLAAGLDTGRATLSTTTYLLAHNVACQERLYEELNKIAKYDETPVGRRLHFDYDELTACQYLDAVLSESLRMFGPVVYTDRVAMNDYHIDKYNVTVPAGTGLMLSLHSLGNDPDYWDQPERFDPERFMPGRKEHIVPGSYVPFSMGPRHCVGMRFSLTEMKLGLAKVIMNYKFAPAPGTKYPPEPTRDLSLIRVRNCKTLVTYRDEQKFQ